jgi:hypothetical protein
LYRACADEQGRVLDDRTEAVRPWVGQHSRALPGPVQVLRGADPLEVLGMATGGER